MTTTDTVERMTGRWASAHVPFVVVDRDGRRDWPPDAGVTPVDLAAHPVDEPGDALDLLRRHPHLVLHAANLPPQRRTGAVAQALIALACLRTWSQGPQWIVVESAADLLADPDLPPEALDVAAGGYCLVGT
jgi:hypothetical protein